MEVAVALAGKLAVAAAVAAEAYAARGVGGLLGVIAAVGALMSVSSAVAGELTEVAASTIAGAGARFRPRAARLVGAAMAASTLAYAGALGVLGVLAALRGGVYGEYAAATALAYAIDAPVFALLRVMRKSGAEGRRWGLWSALLYAVPAAVALVGLSWAGEITPARVGLVHVGACVLGVVPCVLWARRHSAVRVPGTQELALLWARALPLLRGSAVSVFAGRPAFAAALTLLATQQPVAGDAWGAYAAALDALWMLGAQVQGVAGDRVQRARGTADEPRARAEFAHMLRVSVVLWVVLGVALFPAYGLPWWWVALTLPRLYSAVATRPLEADRQWAALARCTAAGAVTQAVTACVVIWWLPTSWLLVGVFAVHCVSCAASMRQGYAEQRKLRTR